MTWQLEEIKNLHPDIKRLSEIKDIVYDKDWLSRNWVSKSTEAICFLYKGIARIEEEAAIKKAGLRYDIVVIPPFLIGKEFVKTAGHYHPIAVDDLTFPEVWQVMEGEAMFLIQKVENFENNNIVDVAFALAKPGDVFIVPPNYGHITINSGETDLVLANWSADGFAPNYEPIKRMCGACYFFTKEGWVKNHRYGYVPDLREINCKPMEDIYNFATDLDKIKFLKDPSIRSPQQQKI
jgi:glucose-6-phosphate isomerase, archaeal